MDNIQLKNENCPNDGFPPSNPVLSNPKLNDIPSISNLMNNKNSPSIFRNEELRNNIQKYSIATLNILNESFSIIQSQLHFYLDKINQCLYIDQYDENKEYVIPENRKNYNKIFFIDGFTIIKYAEGEVWQKKFDKSAVTMENEGISLSIIPHNPISVSCFYANSSTTTTIPIKTTKSKNKKIKKSPNSIQDPPPISPLTPEADNYFLNENDSHKLEKIKKILNFNEIESTPPPSPLNASSTLLPSSEEKDNETKQKENISENQMKKTIKITKKTDPNFVPEKKICTQVVGKNIPSFTHTSHLIENNNQSFNTDKTYCDNLITSPLVPDSHTLQNKPNKINIHKRNSKEKKKKNDIECKFFKSKNGCKKGKSCTFKHIIKCKNGNECKFLPKKRCKFFHEISDSPQINPKKTIKKKICKFFLKNKCKYKEECRNLHEIKIEKNIVVNTEKNKIIENRWTNNLRFIIIEFKNLPNIESIIQIIRKTAKNEETKINERKFLFEFENSVSAKEKVDVLKNNPTIQRAFQCSEFDATSYTSKNSNEPQRVKRHATFAIKNKGVNESNYKRVLEYFGTHSKVLDLKPPNNSKNKWTHIKIEKVTLQIAKIFYNENEKFRESHPTLFHVPIKTVNKENCANCGMRGHHKNCCTEALVEITDLHGVNLCSNSTYASLPIYQSKVPTFNVFRKNFVSKIAEKTEEETNLKRIHIKWTSIEKKKPAKTTSILNKNKSFDQNPLLIESDNINKEINIKEINQKWIESCNINSSEHLNSFIKTICETETLKNSDHKVWKHISENIEFPNFDEIKITQQDEISNLKIFEIISKDKNLLLSGIKKDAFELITKIFIYFHSSHNATHQKTKFDENQKKCVEFLKKEKFDLNSFEKTIELATENCLKFVFDCLVGSSKKPIVKEKSKNQIEEGIENFENQKSFQKKSDESNPIDNTDDINRKEEVESN